MTKLGLNSSFSVSEFLDSSWQRKPALIPQLVPGFHDPISPEELAGLACEELVESRIVSNLEQDRWQVKHGPFAENDFINQPTTNWTVLVQAVDQWVDEVADIKRLFNFIPSWRIDDIMISFAATGGGVGPHYDYYDVFLLQGLGQRTWRVGERCSSDAQLQDNADLKLLSNFRSEQEFVLSSGDALYIPPRFAHWGLADSDSLCYSIGFRAPSIAEMIEGFSDFLIRASDPSIRYEDPSATNPQRSGEIPEEVLAGSFETLSKRFAEKEVFLAWFGCHASRPKYPELVIALTHELTIDEIQLALAEGVTLSKNPSSRFAFMESASEQTVRLFVDGAMTLLPVEQLSAIERLCDGDSTELTADALLRNEDSRELLLRLVNQGSLLLSE